MSRRQKVFLGLGIAGVALIGGLRLFGLIIPYKVPQASMSPAIAPGDHLFMEGFSFLFGKPRRGDILVFRAKDLPMLDDGTVYVKRLVGLPGERLRIADGKLYVNGMPVELSNKSGAIQYVNPPRAQFLSSTNESIVVPEGHYFLLGDNSANSLDGRYWGFLRADLVLGRMSFCYWPPSRTGFVK